MENQGKRIKRPSVLLLGNGLNLSYAGRAMDWKTLIKDGTLQNVPDDIVVPLSLEVVLRTKDRAKDLMKLKSKVLYGRVDTDLFRSSLEEILRTGFDEILTTNYGYELESTAFGTPQISDYRLRRISRSTTGRIDAKYLLHTYNEVTFEGRQNRIWHIHGEAKKPGSMVIDHYHYGSLLNRFVNFYRWRGNDYKTYKAYEDVPKESWLDAFLMGDVYILGQGLDFAEMDLWWLVNRKKTDKNAGGHIYFYEPKSDRNYDSKIELLKIYGATPLDLGFELPEKPTHRAAAAVRAKYIQEKNEVFSAFYQKALEDIRRRVEAGAKK